MNRHAKERLIQADTLWAMLRRGEPAPSADFDEAWRNVLLGSEHTWCYSQPEKQPITDNILNVKFSYFQQAHCAPGSLRPGHLHLEVKKTVWVSRQTQTGLG